MFQVWGLIMLFLLIIINGLFSCSMMFSGESNPDEFIFGKNGPYFSSEQVKATSDTHICEVDGEEYKNFLKAVKGRMERRLEELPEVDRTRLNRLEKEYTHELGPLDLELQKIEIIPSWHNWVFGPIVEMQIKKNMGIYGCAAREVKDYEQQFKEWSDQINGYNACTALKVRAKHINNTLNGKHNAALLLGTHHHKDGSVHMYEGQPVKLPIEVIKQISRYVSAVSERDVVKYARWIDYLDTQSHQEPYGIKGIKVAKSDNKYMPLSRKSELGFILRSHCYYKYRAEAGSARFRKSKYWNIELPLKDATHQKYGPSLYFFDEKGWEQDKLQEREAL